MGFKDSTFATRSILVINDIKKYGDMGHIAQRIIYHIIEKNVNKFLNNSNENIIQDRLQIDSHIFYNLTEIFDHYFAEDFLKISVLKNMEFDTSWLEKRESSVYSILTENIVHGDSLVDFLRNIDSELKEEVSIKYLRIQRSELLLKIEEFCKILNKENKKLTSWYSFLYGSGNKILLDEIKSQS